MNTFDGLHELQPSAVWKYSVFTQTAISWGWC